MPNDGDAEPTESMLRAAHCWENDDRVPGDPAMTAFRRTARYRQARWREAHGHPIGTQPIRPLPGKAAKPVGSRVPLDHAERTGANFVTAAAFDAVRERLGRIEPHQSVDRQRLLADLTLSTPLAFNLFGELAADLAGADRLVHDWFPDTVGTVSAVRFVHSPGRFDPDYLNSLRDFAATFEIDRGDGTSGMIAVDVKFFERAKPETPKPENMWRYRSVAEASGVFVPGAIEHFAGSSPHCVMWLEHLLLLSMLQHPSRHWTWGRYVVVHHPDNPAIAALLDSYRQYLSADTTYRTIALDELLDGGTLPADTTESVRDRYLDRS